MKPATTLAMILFAIIALVHVLRLALGIPVAVSGRSVPMWASVLGLLVSSGVAFGIWREHRTR